MFFHARQKTSTAPKMIAEIAEIWQEQILPHAPHFRQFYMHYIYPTVDILIKLQRPTVFFF